MIRNFWGSESIREKEQSNYMKSNEKKKKEKEYRNTEHWRKIMSDSGLQNHSSCKWHLLWERAKDIKVKENELK